MLYVKDMSLCLRVNRPVYCVPAGGVVWWRSGECLCCVVCPPGLNSSPAVAALFDAASRKVGGVVVIARSGDRLGAGTIVTVPVEPADGLMSSARGGGSTCREKLLVVIKFLLGDWITTGDTDVSASFVRGVLELRLAASAAGRLFDVKVVELLRSAGVAGSSDGRAPAAVGLRSSARRCC
jgi:hypothetical protein